MAGKTEFIASLETDVPVRRSVEHIRALIERFGASEFTIQYDPVSGQPSAIAFKIRDTALGKYLPVALRAPTSVLEAGVRRWRSSWSAERVREQAERVAWRNLHDFVRASLIGVQTGIMSLAEAFMASLVVTLPTGEAKRLGELAAEGSLLRPASDDSGRLMLGKGS